MNKKERELEIVRLRKQLDDLEQELFGTWREGKNNPALTTQCCDVGKELEAAEKMFHRLYGEVP